MAVEIPLKQVSLRVRTFVFRANGFSDDCWYPYVKVAQYTATNLTNSPETSVTASLTRRNYN